MIKWETVKITENQWAIYMKDQNTEYKDAEGDNLVFDTKKEAQDFINALS